MRTWPGRRLVLWAYPPRAFPTRLVIVAKLARSDKIRPHSPTGLVPLGSDANVAKPIWERQRGYMPSRDERLSSHSGCKGRSVRNSFARQRLNCRSAALATMALVAVTAFAPGAARAQDATWLPNPASGDFNTAINWNPATVPTGTAFFGASEHHRADVLGQHHGRRLDIQRRGLGLYVSLTISTLSSMAPASSLSAAAPPSTTTSHLDFTINSTAGSATIPTPASWTSSVVARPASHHHQRRFPTFSDTSRPAMPPSSTTELADFRRQAARPATPPSPTTAVTM